MFVGEVLFFPRFFLRFFPLKICCRPPPLISLVRSFPLCPIFAHVLLFFVQPFPPVPFPFSLPFLMVYSDVRVIVILFWLVLMISPRFLTHIVRIDAPADTPGWRDAHGTRSKRPPQRLPAYSSQPSAPSSAAGASGTPTASPTHEGGVAIPPGEWGAVERAIRAAASALIAAEPVGGWKMEWMRDREGGIWYLVGVTMRVWAGGGFEEGWFSQVTIWQPFSVGKEAHLHGRQALFALPSPRSVSPPAPATTVEKSRVRWCSFFFGSFFSCVLLSFSPPCGSLLPCLYFPSRPLLAPCLGGLLGLSLISSHLSSRLDA